MFLHPKCAWKNWQNSQTWLSRRKGHLWRGESTALMDLITSATESKALSFECFILFLAAFQRLRLMINFISKLNPQPSVTQQTRVKNGKIFAHCRNKLKLTQSGSLMLIAFVFCRFLFGFWGKLCSENKHPDSINPITSIRFASSASATFCIWSATMSSLNIYAHTVPCNVQQKSPASFMHLPSRAV